MRMTQYPVQDNNYYFGKNTILVPAQYRIIIKKGPGHKCNFPQYVIDDFISWIKESYKPGIYGEPTNGLYGD